MCQIFAGQDHDNYSYVSRSIRLDGQVTVFVSRAFTGRYSTKSLSRRVYNAGFISKLHREVMELQGAPQNFTSLLRSACLIYMDNRLATRMEDQRQRQAS